MRLLRSRRLSLRLRALGIVRSFRQKWFARCRVHKKLPAYKAETCRASSTIALIKRPAPLQPREMLSGRSEPETEQPVANLRHLVPVYLHNRRASFVRDDCSSKHSIQFPAKRAHVAGDVPNDGVTLGAPVPEVRVNGQVLARASSADLQKTSKCRVHRAHGVAKANCSTRRGSGRLPSTHRDREVRLGGPGWWGRHVAAGESALYWRRRPSRHGKTRDGDFRLKPLQSAGCAIAESPCQSRRKCEQRRHYRGHHGGWKNRKRGCWAQACVRSGRVDVQRGRCCVTANAHKPRSGAAQMTIRQPETGSKASPGLLSTLLQP